MALIGVTEFTHRWGPLIPGYMDHLDHLGCFWAEIRSSRGHACGENRRGSFMLPVTVGLLDHLDGREMALPGYPGLTFTVLPVEEARRVFLKTPPEVTDAEFFSKLTDVHPYAVLVRRQPGC